MNYIEPGTQIVDELNAVHTLAKKIGEGGQGTVWINQGKNRIVKLMRHRDPERLRRQLIRVRNLDLSGLCVARPIALLKPPHIGYVAEFLKEMVPIKGLMATSDEDILPFYLDSGGLRRRLRLLAHVGEALLGLHAKGAIYSDISPNNIFVSESVEATEAWLIDLDNVTQTKSPEFSVYTPGYGAPEVVTGKELTDTYSDMWAFAVLCYQTLTLNHPLIGDMVDDGEPELEEKAYRGELPWVNSQEDYSNESSVGIPAEYVLGWEKNPTTKEQEDSQLMKLARQTFEVGKRDRTKRPSIAKWVDALHAAADFTIRCPSCEGTYFANEVECPWCEEPRPSVSIIGVSRWQKYQKSKENRQLVFDSRTLISPVKLVFTNEMILTKRLTLSLSGKNSRHEHIKFERIPRGVKISLFHNESAWYAERTKETDPKTKEPYFEISSKKRLLNKSIVIKQGTWVIFPQEPTKSQRIFQISIRGGQR